MKDQHRRPGFVLRLDDERLRQLNQLAERLGVNRSSVVRLILAEELPVRLRAATDPALAETAPR